MSTTSISISMAAGAALVLASGCVLNSTYADAMDRWTEKFNTLQAETDTLRAERDALAAEKEKLNADLGATSSALSENKAVLEHLDKKVSEQGAELASTQTQLQDVSTQASKLDEQAKKLQDEKQKLTAERESLANEVKELRRLRAASEARNQEYKGLLEKLKKMIDAGSLEVKIRNGLMLVTMPSDVLFPAGEATLKPEAVAAINELVGTLKGFTGRRFQVIGHSDSTPISTEKFASNWELSTQRAVEVVKVMIAAGMPAKMVSAAGAAETDPVAKNSSSKGKAQNRRVELVFVPSIDELPGFELGK